MWAETGAMRLRAEMKADSIKGFIVAVAVSYRSNDDGYRRFKVTRSVSSRWD